MIKKLFSIICLLFSVFALICNVDIDISYADELSDSVNEQLQNIDFSELSDFVDSLTVFPDNYDLFSMINLLLQGEYNQDYNSILEYAINLLFNSISNFLPVLIGVLAISIFCGIMQNSRSVNSDEGVSNVTFWVCFLSIVLVLSTSIIACWNTTKNAIENIAKLSEIMSPIILSLMVASGGNVSASMYTPTVAFLSNCVTNVVLSIVMPLVGVFIVFSIISHFSTNVKINKLIDFVCGVIKWVLGITLTVFTLFMSVNGISSSSHDGISIKLAKYTISNSVPIIGGFLRDGFDVVMASSVLIKNAVGIGGVFTLFYIVLTPALTMAGYSLAIKFIAGLIEPISDVRLSNICVSVSKCISYLNTCLLLVGFMLFITMLLMTFSVNLFV